MRAPPCTYASKTGKRGISKEISGRHFIRILCRFAPRFPSPLLCPSSFYPRFCLSPAFLRSLSLSFPLLLLLLLPVVVKSLEASRRGRERRLVTFPSRPLFLSSTPTPCLTKTRENSHAGSTVGAQARTDRLHFPPFYPLLLHYLSLPGRESGRVSRCILMKKFVTSLRHPTAAASAKRRRW